MTERPFEAPVPGGILRGSQWRAEASGVPVLTLPGITANHRSFAPLAALLGQRVIAPDLRGRGRSRDLPPPYDLDRLADDAAAALDAAEVQQAVVVGHSMGAFVAVLLAERHPDRVAGLVLVDGGLPLPAAEDPTAALGPAMQRLAMTFDSPAAYRDFWRQHPALGPWWSPAVEAYVDYDLVSTPEGLRSSVVADAVSAAMLELSDDRFAAALERVRVPVILLRSPRGLFDETPGLYDDERLAAWRRRVPGLTVEDVDNTNHYTILLGAGVDRVAAVVGELISAADAEPMEDAR